MGYDVCEKWSDWQIAPGQAGDPSPTKLRVKCAVGAQRIELDRLENEMTNNSRKALAKLGFVNTIKLVRSEQELAGKSILEIIQIIAENTPEKDRDKLIEVMFAGEDAVEKNLQIEICKLCSEASNLAGDLADLLRQHPAVLRWCYAEVKSFNNLGDVERKNLPSPSPSSSTASSGTDTSVPPSASESS